MLSMRCCFAALAHTRGAHICVTAMAVPVRCGIGLCSRASLVSGAGSHLRRAPGADQRPVFEERKFGHLEQAFLRRAVRHVHVAQQHAALVLPHECAHAAAEVPGVQQVVAHTQVERHRRLRGRGRVQLTLESLWSGDVLFR